MKSEFLIKHVGTAMWAGLFLSILIFSCSGNEVIPEPDPTPEPEPVPEVIPVSKGAYKSVVILGVDGAGAFFSADVTPNTSKIFAKAPRSYNTQASTPSISAQCWGSMLHGVLPEFHRLTNDVAGRKRYDPESPYPSIFRIIREAEPNAALASFCNWDTINYGIIENNLSVVEGTGNDAEVTSKVVAYLEKNSPTFLFVQFDSVDGAGHGNGYGTAGHKAALTVVDGYIKQIYDALEKKGVLDRTLFIVTADHGGTPDGSHGGDSAAEMNVFLGVAGRTVQEQGLIVDSEVRDVAAIAAYALGLEFPETWTGRVPTGVFPGVTATERKTCDIPVSKNRRHKTVPTPESSELKTLLASHDVVAYLPFDSDFKDAFGRAATSLAGKIYYYDAWFGKGAALYDGHVTLKDVSVGKNSFSAAFWIKSGEVSGDPSIISNKNWDNGGNDGFVLSLRPGDIKFNAGCKEREARMDAAYSLPLDYKEGWMHVVCTVDRKAGKVRLYYDFKYEDECDIPESLADVSFDALDLNIGQDGRGTYSSVLSAQLDEFILTMDVLSESDVESLKEFYNR